MVELTYENLPALVNAHRSLNAERVTAMKDGKPIAYGPGELFFANYFWERQLIDGRSVACLRPCECAEAKTMLTAVQNSAGETIAIYERKPWPIFLEFVVV